MSMVRLVDHIEGQKAVGTRTQSSESRSNEARVKAKANPEQKY